MTTKAELLGEYEYHETTSEMDEGRAVPPQGSGWEHVTAFPAGRMTVHRWRRKRRLLGDMVNSKVSALPDAPNAALVMQAMFAAADKLGAYVTIENASIKIEKRK